jgi:tetratricopeptide (TPR) repeat protein
MRLPGKTGVHLALILFLGFLVYSNTFNAPFVLDDGMYITENPTIRDFSYLADSSKADGLKLGIVRRYLDTRIVGYMSFWANYMMSGLNVWGYHAVNLVIHLINSLLVYVFVILTFKTPSLKASRVMERYRHIALFSMLLFMTHPLQTESVTYITQRFGELATMFYLLSTVTYIKSRLSAGRASRYVFYAASFLSAVLAMKSKENAFTLPLALMLHEFMFFRGRVAGRCALLMPLVLTMLIIPIGYISMQGGGFVSSLEGSTRLGTDISRLEYLYTQFRVIMTYIRLLFLPVNQNLDYGYPIYSSFIDPPVILSFLCLLGAFALGVYLLYRSRIRTELRIVSFGIFWFFLALSVESSVIPVSETIFEYRAYLPSAGFFTAAASGTFLFAGRLKSSKTITVTVIFFILVTFLSSCATYARNNLWRSELRLWEDTVGKSPGKARPHINLGMAFMSEGLTGQAEGHFKTALELAPDNAEAHNNLGAVYATRGEISKAIKHFQLAVMNDPDFAEARINLGYAYYLSGWPEDAIEQYGIALEIQPGNQEARERLGLAHKGQGLPDERPFNRRER